MSADHVLLIGFGGPTKPEEIRPFLQQVTRGIPVPPERLAEVERHYHAVGGRSPYTEHALRFSDALRAALQAQGVTVPVFLGMRNWHPLLRDVMREIKRAGLRQGLGVILAPHRSDSSFEKYLRNVEDAAASASAQIAYRYLESWHTHPLFIEAQAEQTRRALAKLAPAEREKAVLLFSAHSIPVRMAGASRYAQEVEASSAAVARALDRPAWRIAYQSRSGGPSEPWLEPDVATRLQALAREGCRAVVLVPIGFVCDHVEVLFDLDLEARGQAERLGLRVARASSVMDHPRFVEMFTRLIGEALRRDAGAPAGQP